MARGGRPTSWIYSLRKNAKGSQLAVPREIAEQIPAGAMFQLEVTPDGLLYKYTTQVEKPAEAVSLPWIKENA